MRFISNSLTGGFKSKYSLKFLVRDGFFRVVTGFLIFTSSNLSGKIAVQHLTEAPNPGII